MRSVGGLALALCLSLSAPARADVQLHLDGDLGQALRQLFDEMKPHLDEAFRMLEGIESLEAIADPRHYEMPEVLPNGDIIIRRREDAPPLQQTPRPDLPTPDDETIDL